MICWSPDFARGPEREDADDVVAEQRGQLVAGIGETADESPYSRRGTYRRRGGHALPADALRPHRIRL
jgi:hypothetical protein